MQKKKEVLIIDHFDSFTYNLLQYIGELGVEVGVVRTDTLLNELEKLRPDFIVLSPGYGHPQDVKCFQEAINLWSGIIPILGVCLGHQAIAMAKGAKVTRNYRIMHGKSSPVFHNSCSLFKGISNPFLAGRYHSLVVSKEDCETHGLEVIARTEENEVMAISDKHSSIYGIQFHPESILTPDGKKMLSNFLQFS